MRQNCQQTDRPELVETIIDRFIFDDGSELVLKVKVPAGRADDTALATYAHQAAGRAADDFTRRYKERGGV